MHNSTRYPHPENGVRRTEHPHKYVTGLKHESKWSPVRQERYFDLMIFFVEKADTSTGITENDIKYKATRTNN
jgi:hypothetical protein